MFICVFNFICPSFGNVEVQCVEMLKKCECFFNRFKLNLPYIFQKVDCVRKYVQVGNPVVSLDNISVFAKKERKEQIAKKTVTYPNLLVC